MNKTLHSQVHDLQRKIDHLHHLLLEVHQQLAHLTSSASQTRPLPQTPTKKISLPDLLEDSVEMTHKDVLIDEEEALPFWTLNGDHTLSKDLQVRRLTAQLTAAYHRIAALEEQLIVRRIQS